MPEQLKFFFSPTLVRRLAGDLVRVHPAFDHRAFVRDAIRGLDDLELLDRGKHISRAMARHLPPHYGAAIDILLKSLGPEHATDELVGAGMAPFYYLPHTVFVAERGLGHFEISMKAQHELTRRFSAESSIRPFIAQDPDRTLHVLKAWTRDRNAHVRRLVSEGTRLRLPWAMRVPWLDANPQRVLDLLELLKDDPAPLVRRSVANNLNDLGKVHPALLVHTCEMWLRDATEERRALVEHALRSAVKRGDADALRLLGFGKKPAVVVESARFSQMRVPIGGKISIAFTIRSTSSSRQDLLIDLAVHFVKSRGKSSKKVFKVARISLPPRSRADFSTSVSLKVHTTRNPNPGKHAVDVIVNGISLPIGSFDVISAKARRTPVQARKQ